MILMLYNYQVYRGRVLVLSQKAKMSFCQRTSWESAKEREDYFINSYCSLVRCPLRIISVKVNIRNSSYGPGSLPLHAILILRCKIQLLGKFLLKFPPDQPAPAVNSNMMLILQVFDKKSSQRLNWQNVKKKLISFGCWKKNDLSIVLT